MTFNIGDIVRLNSENKNITIRAISEKGIVCDWFSDDKLYTAEFIHDQLSLVKSRITEEKNEIVEELPETDEYNENSVSVSQSASEEQSHENESETVNNQITDIFTQGNDSDSSNDSENNKEQNL